MALNSIIADSKDNSELQKMVNPRDKVIVIAFGRREQLVANPSLPSVTASCPKRAKAARSGARSHALASV